MNKKIIAFIVIVLVVLTMGVSAFAASPTPVATASGAPAPQPSGDILVIDSANKYAGMNVPYQNGYSPSTANGVANILLPLRVAADSVGIKDGIVNLSVNLGDASTAPFVFSNYDKSIGIGNYPVNDGAATADVYLVAFDLPLVANRTMGRYPVVITARYMSADDMPMTQEFTVFVTINDGKDPNATPTPEPTPTPDKPEAPTSQPKIIISNYTITPEKAYAGEKFKVDVTLENTSKSSSVKNITVTYKSVTADMIPGDNANTEFIDKIGADATAKFSFSMEARADAKAGPQKIDIAIAYEDSKATPLTATDEITVQIRQKIRLEYDQPKFPPQAYMGDAITATLNLYNKGKNTLYNVTVKLDVPGIKPDSSAFLGNMESGASKTADIYASVAAAPQGVDEGTGDIGGATSAGNTKMEGGGTEVPISMDNNPNASNEPVSQIQPGPVEGNFIVTYEDEYGDEYELKVPVKTELVQMQTPEEPMPEDVPQENAGFPWWGYVIIAGGVAAVVIIILVKKKKKKRAQELMEDMDDDDIL
ncbi:MAG: hypothetical protein RSA86_06920 [Christensenellaceae bacterium]